MSDTLTHDPIPFGGRETLPPAPVEKLLGPDEQVQIELQSPLADSQEMLHKMGLSGNLVATVKAGDKSFLIVDVRKGRERGDNRDFIIADETFSIPQKQGYKGVCEGFPVVVGRSQHTNRFNYPNTVSKDHFEVAYQEGGLFIRNLRPTNKTFVTARLRESANPIPQPFSHKVNADRTRLVEQRLIANPNIGEKDATAPYGYYMNHPRLGRSSQSVDGGVYLGGTAREAIVVDGKSALIRQTYQDLATELKSSFKNEETIVTAAVLLKVLNKVQEVMPYNGPKTNDIGREYHGDKLIGLSTYVKERAGVCRHQALLAAYLIENLIKDGLMLGSVGVERNTVPDMGGTHAWAVYKTRSNGKEEVIVVDPAQTFVGTKAQAQREGRWEYRLSTEEY